MNAETLFGGVSVINSPLGKAFSSMGTGTVGNRVQWASAGGASPTNPYKIDPPFTLSAVVRIPTVPGGHPFFFATDLKTTAPLAKYAGVMINCSDGGQLQVLQFDNTGVLLTPSAIGPTSAYALNSDIPSATWNHFVVRVSPIIQGNDLDSDPNKYVRFWLNGREEKDTLTVVGQTSVVHAVTQHACVGGQRNDGVIDPGEFDLAYWQLWTRMLSVAEINQLSADPLAMLRPKRSHYAMPIAATGRFVSLGGYYKNQTRAVLVG
jgi:hypothetical protein